LIVQTAINDPGAIVLQQQRSAALEDSDPNGVEIKPTHVRHLRCLDFRAVQLFFIFLGKR
jgi:hypothetical protein